MRGLEVEARSDGSEYRQILGVRFFTGTAGEAVRRGLRGGLVVVPSAPALLGVEDDHLYRQAVLDADLVITDSGLMVLVWWLLTGERITRVSGLEYLRLLLDADALREPGSVLWIMPTPAARDRAIRWLGQIGIACSEEDCYVAPFYPPGEIGDEALLARVRTRRPRHIVVGLGGGTQERLGLFLRRRLDYGPGIHCIGAAIGFLSGDQVSIPRWADHACLGWLFRCLSEPRRFVPRYWRARRLVSVMWRYGERLPEFVGGTINSDLEGCGPCTQTPGSLSRATRGWSGRPS